MDSEKTRGFVELRERDRNPVVVVVDHDVLPRNLLATILQGEGHTVLAAAHGREALELCLSYPLGVSLLIADVNLPHLNGFELAEALRREKPAVKVLLLSGKDSDESAAHGRGLAFMRKPLDREFLSRLVRQLIQK